MIPGIDLGKISEMTPTGLLIIVILAIFLGLLVPVRFYKQVNEQLKYERETTKQQREVIEKLTEGFELVKTIGENVNHLYAGLQHNARENGHDVQ